MAATDLDPMFVKALRLLQSRSKDSTDQLKQMLDEVIAQRKSEKSLVKDVKVKLEGNDSPTDKPYTKLSSGKKDESRKREADKKSDKSKSTVFDDLLPEPVVKKQRLEVAKSDSRSSSRSGSPVNIDLNAKEKKYLKDRSSDSDRSISDMIKQEIESSESDDDAESVEEMDAGDVAMDMGLSCIVCRQFNSTPKNQLIECQECHSLYHQYCHRQPVTESNVNDPRFVWYCSKCQKNMKKLVTTKPSKPKPSTPPLVKETKTVKDIKTEATPILPFRRLDSGSVKTSSGKESSVSRPFSGLASLADRPKYGSKDSKTTSKPSSESSKRESGGLLSLSEKYTGKSGDSRPKTSASSAAPSRDSSKSSHQRSESGKSSSSSVKSDLHRSSSFSKSDQAKSDKLDFASQLSEPDKVLFSKSKSSSSLKSLGSSQKSSSSSKSSGQSKTPPTASGNSKTPPSAGSGNKPPLTGLAKLASAYTAGKSSGSSTAAPRSSSVSSGSGIPSKISSGHQRSGSVSSAKPPQHPSGSLHKTASSTPKLKFNKSSSSSSSSNKSSSSSSSSSSGGAGGSSTTSGTGTGGKSSIMNADKRLQIMKKKAEAKMREKRASLK